MSGSGRKLATSFPGGTTPVDDTARPQSHKPPQGPPAYDGPASTPGSHGRRTSNTVITPSTSPQMGHGGSQQPPSPRVGGSQQPPSPRHGSPQAQHHRTPSSGSQPQVPPPGRPVTDPARERPVRLTDNVRNVDLPASCYNVDDLVSRFSHSNFSSNPLRVFLVVSFPLTKSSLLFRRILRNGQASTIPEEAFSLPSTRTR